MIEMNFEVTI